MTSKELVFVAKLLDLAADTFSSRGSNDLDAEMLDFIGFTDTEKQALALKFSQWAEEVVDPEELIPFEVIGDSSWMKFWSEYLMLEAVFQEGEDGVKT